MLKHAGEFVEVACPACGGANRRSLWTKSGFQFVQCTGCETAYVNPRPTSDLLAEHYRTATNYQFWSGHVFPASEPTRRENIVRPRVRRIIDICERQGIPRPRLLVEVGAGHGTFCEEARDSNRFQRVLAVEPVPSNAETIRKRGVDVIDKPIERVALEALGADVVVSFELIEHLFDPYGFVKACVAALSPRGLFVVSCPNLKGFEVAALGVHSRTVDLEHLNYFHPASLAHLLKRCGLEIIELSTPGQLDAEIVRKRALAGLVNLDERPFLKTILIDRWDELGRPFQDFLATHLLSSHMWAVARKP